MSGALGFLFTVAVCGAVCGLVDSVQNVIGKMVAVSATVTEQGGVNTNEYFVAR